MNASSTECFATKAEARAAVWRRLSEQGLARAPLPCTGRIPNFIGAEEAARCLFDHEPWRSARTLKINPDSAQSAVRREALARGVVVYVPTPGLAGGFHRLDPATISSSDLGPAALMSNIACFGVVVSLIDLPQMDGIVTGSVAVTARGKRCGKGAGYSDIEYAILEELGHAPAPVATTVHEQQIVGDFPVASHDLSLSLIVTPDGALSVATMTASRHGLVWDLLSADALEKMPLLLELRAHLAARAMRIIH